MRWLVAFDQWCQHKKIDSFVPVAPVVVSAKFVWNFYVIIIYKIIKWWVLLLNYNFLYNLASLEFLLGRKISIETANEQVAVSWPVPPYFAHPFAVRMPFYWKLRTVLHENWFNVVTHHKYAIWMISGYFAACSHYFTIQVLSRRY